MMAFAILLGNLSMLVLLNALILCWLRLFNLFLQYRFSIYKVDGGIIIALNVNLWIIREVLLQCG